MRIHALLELNLIKMCVAGVTQQVESRGFLHNKRHRKEGGMERWEGRRETRFPSLFKGEPKYMY